VYVCMYVCACKRGLYAFVGAHFYSAVSSLAPVCVCVCVFVSVCGLRNRV